MIVLHAGLLDNSPRVHSENAVGDLHGSLLVSHHENGGTLVCNSPQGGKDQVRILVI